MRNGGYVLNERNFQAHVSERSDCRLSALTGAFYINFDRTKSVFHCSLSSRFRSLLSRKRSAFSRTFEAERTRTAVSYVVSVCIGNGYDGVVKGGFDMNLTFVYVFRLFTFFNDFLYSSHFCLPPFIICLRSSSLRPCDADPFWFSRFSSNSVLLRANLFCVLRRDSNRFP